MEEKEKYDFEDIVKNMVSLSELIEVAKKYISGEIKDVELNEFAQKLSIRSYIPINEKKLYVMTLLTSLMYTTPDGGLYEENIVNLYKDMFFYVLLGGYSFINCDDLSLMTEENYDLLYPIFGDYILQYCKNDYEICKDLIRDSLNLYHFDDLLNSFRNIDEDKLGQAIEINKNVMKSLEENKDLIEKLNKIAAFNDPFTRQVADMIKDQAVEKARKEIKNNVEVIEEVVKKRGRKKKTPNN